MSALERIAFFLNRRDEVPNQELARALAQAQDAAGIAEIAAGLEHKNHNVRSDCLKVLYEIGYLQPELIAAYAPRFLALLQERDNRMVWGAMIALATIASLRPAELGAQVDLLVESVERGSLITVVWGVRALARLAAADPAYLPGLFPFLLDQLHKCIPRDLPTHAESMLCAVDAAHAAPFRALLESRRPELTPAQQTRLKKVLRQLPA